MDSAARYTITELAEASAAVLDALGIAARNGQVRDRPDVRTVRYYGTLGLVDPPAEMAGRTARYGSRHLLQVVAVKAAQARGDSLADAQRILVGASDEELRSAIGPGLPSALAAATAPTAALGESDGIRAPGSPFWRTSPVLPVAAGAAAGPAADVPDSGTSEPVRSTGSTGSLEDARLTPRPFVAVPLEAGATLLIEGAAVGAVDTAALRAAAVPLLAYLTEAGLLPGPPNHQGATP
jgi:DNA-binding transcriptional MerR regulator